MISVWRVQNEEGLGPYNSMMARWDEKKGCAMRPWQTQPHTESTGRPSPYQEGCECICPNEYFGFRSQAQLQQWFTPQELKNLERLGFKAVQVQVHRVLWESPRQLLFVW